MTGRWWVERNQGWWHSRIPDFPDPLTLVAPRSFGICVIAGNTLTLTLFMIGRRYGWKGQAIAVLSVGLVLPLLERFWFSELIPALQYQPFNPSHAFGSAGILIAASIATIVATRLIGGPYPKKL